MSLGRAVMELCAPRTLWFHSLMPRFPETATSKQAAEQNCSEVSLPQDLQFTTYFLYTVIPAPAFQLHYFLYRGGIPVH